MALATYPEVERDGPPLLPYLVLLRVGFALPAELLQPRCALTAPFHPYPKDRPAKPAHLEAVYFLWHFPSDLAIRPAVSRHAALWRPDFPPPDPLKRGLEATTRPAVLPYYCRIARWCSAQRSTELWILRIYKCCSGTKCLMYPVSSCFGPRVLVHTEYWFGEPLGCGR